MEEFYTRDAANEGIKMPLYTPSGKKTEHWMLVLGRDSDAFREAESKAIRAAMNKGGDYNEMEGKRVLVAALVADWSLPKPCTKDHVVEFLRNAPQIMDEINITAGDRATFFALRSSSLNDLPEENLQPGESSTESAKETT